MFITSAISWKDDTKVRMRINFGNLGLVQQNWRVILFVIFPTAEDRLWLPGSNVTSHLSAQRWTLASSKLLSSLNGVMDNDIQASIISKKSNREVNVYNNVINVQGKQEMSKNRTLWNSSLYWSPRRTCTRQSYLCFLSVRQSEKQK